MILQLTEITSGTVEDPRIRSMDGGTVVFTSDGDVLGPSNGSREVYFYDFETDIMRAVTNNPLHNSDQAARSTDTVFAAGRPAWVALVSTDDLDLDHPNGNLDGNPEIFLWEHESNIFHQITDTLPPVINANPYGSDSGKGVVFDSNGELDNNDGSDDQAPSPGYTNPDGSREVFLFHVLTSNNFPNEHMITQVSNGPAGTTSWRPVIGGYWFPRQLQSTVYMSDHDQVGGGRVGTHIYVYTRPNAQTAALDAPEIPKGQPDGNYLFPHISSASPFARGPFTVFETSADLWNNGSTGSQMYRYRIFHPRMTQYTSLTIGDVTRPVVSDGGGVIVMEGTGELLNPEKKIKPEGVAIPPLNPDNNKEIFWQKGRRKITQVTQTSGCTNDVPSVRDDGTAVAFRSTCDLVPGHNPSGLQQVFVWKLVKANDPLSCKKPDKPCECELANGCCNEANGCLTHIQGRTIRPPKKNCLDKPSGC